MATTPAADNLDEKLEDLSIWIEANRDVSPQAWEDEIWPLIKGKIKQAFKDAGWTSPEDTVELHKAVNEFTNIAGRLLNQRVGRND